MYLRPRILLRPSESSPALPKKSYRFTRCLPTLLPLEAYISLMTYFLNSKKCAVLPVFQKYMFTQQEADHCVWLTCEHSPLDTLTKPQLHMRDSWSIMDPFSDGAWWWIQCWDVMDMSVREFLDGINWGQKTSCLRLHSMGWVKRKKRGEHQHSSRLQIQCDQPPPASSIIMMGFLVLPSTYWMNNWITWRLECNVLPWNLAHTMNAH